MGLGSGFCFVCVGVFVRLGWVNLVVFLYEDDLFVWCFVVDEGVEVLVYFGLGDGDFLFVVVVVDDGLYLCL